MAHASSMTNCTQQNANEPSGRPPNPDTQVENPTVEAFALELNTAINSLRVRLTDEELTAHLGIDRNQLDSIARGDLPGIDQLTTICAAAGVPIEHLFALAAAKA